MSILEVKLQGNSVLYIQESIAENEVNEIIKIIDENIDKQKILINFSKIESLDQDVLNQLITSVLEKKYPEKKIITLSGKKLFSQIQNSENYNVLNPLELSEEIKLDITHDQKKMASEMIDEISRMILKTLNEQINPERKNVIDVESSGIKNNTDKINDLIENVTIYIEFKVDNIDVIVLFTFDEVAMNHYVPAYFGLPEEPAISEGIEMAKEFANIVFGKVFTNLSTSQKIERSGMPEHFTNSNKDVILGKAVEIVPFKIFENNEYIHGQIITKK